MKPNTNKIRHHHKRNRIKELKVKALARFKSLKRKFNKIKKASVKQIKSPNTSDDSGTSRDVLKAAEVKRSQSLENILQIIGGYIEECKNENSLEIPSPNRNTNTNEQTPEEFQKACEDYFLQLGKTSNTNTDDGRSGRDLKLNEDYGLSVKLIDGSYEGNVSTFVELGETSSHYYVVEDSDEATRFELKELMTSPGFFAVTKSDEETVSQADSVLDNVKSQTSTDIETIEIHVAKKRGVWNGLAKAITDVLTGAEEQAAELFELSVNRLDDQGAEVLELPVTIEEASETLDLPVAGIDEEADEATCYWSKKT